MSWGSQLLSRLSAFDLLVVVAIHLLAVIYLFETCLSVLRPAVDPTGKEGMYF